MAWRARYVLHDRTLQDWTIVPALLRIPGVAEVSTCGTPPKQFHVLVSPRELDAARAVLRAPHLTIADLAKFPNGGASPDLGPRTCFAFDSGGRDLVEGAVWIRPDADREQVGAAVRAALATVPGVELAGGQFDAIVAVPRAASDFINHIEVPPGVLVELGHPDGGFYDALPGELHLHGTDRDAVERAATQLAETLHGATWTGEVTTTKIFGPDLEELAKLSDRSDLVERSARFEQSPASYASLQTETGAVWDGDKRFDVVVRTGAGSPRPAQRVPAVILRENGSRYALLRSRAALDLKVPAGYSVQ